MTQIAARRQMWMHPTDGEMAKRRPFRVSSLMLNQRKRTGRMSETGKLKLDDQLCFALYAATRAVDGAYRPLLSRIGLSYQQYVVMLALWQDGPLAPDALARRVGETPGALAQTVNRLEASDFVIRLRDAEDGRVVCIAPTRAGAELEREASEAQAAVRCRTLLEDAEHDALRAQLKALVAAVSGAQPE